jgi:argininosuccinate lyase
MASVTYDYARMQEAGTGGFMNALAGAAYLVRNGVPFRQAHEMIGKAVQVCVQKGCEIEDHTATELAGCGIAADSPFYDALQLQQVLAIHDVPGGTAPLQVRAALKKAKETLSSYAGAAHVCA